MRLTCLYTCVLESLGAEEGGKGVGIIGMAGGCVGRCVEVVSTVDDYGRISREAWKAEALDDRPPSKGRERATVNQTNIGTVSKATLGKLLRGGVEPIRAFPSAAYVPS